MTSSTRREAPLWAFPVIGYVRGFAGCRKCARVSQAVTCWCMCDAQLVPWESCATAGGCVCRGEHRSSAVDANDNTTPMQIRTRLGFANLHRRVPYLGLLPRTADGRPYKVTLPVGAAVAAWVSQIRGWRGRRRSGGRGRRGWAGWSASSSGGTWCRALR